MSTVQVIDLKEYSNASAKNYKEVSVEESFPINSVIVEYSRYEVLDQLIRKPYIDADGIPNTPENADFAKNLAKDFNDWLIEDLRLNLENGPLQFVFTKNENSTTHAGLSFHLICFNYSMNYQMIKNALICFVNTNRGRKYDNYIDVGVYTSLRLFKLPNFIGIPMNDVKNYHKPITPIERKEHYIIQLVEGLPEIKHIFRVSKAMKRKAARKAGNKSPQNPVFYKALCDAMNSFTAALSGVGGITTQYNTTSIEDKIKELTSNSSISQVDKIKLRNLKPQTSPAIAKATIKIICQKYGLSYE